MLNLIAAVLCLSEPTVFGLLGYPFPVWATITCIFVGAANLIIWEHNR